jgi:DNA-binding response OmpR family regulator
VTKQNLLVVDADPRSLRVLEVSLRNAGYNVAGCPSVGKAFEILHANKPDLILSDTTFSDMNGFAFVEQLRQNAEWSEIPFMFLSSDGSIESKIRGLELGVEDYLTKPIYIREVIARVAIELARQARAGLAHKSSDSKTRFSGSLSEMSVVDLLQTIDVSRKSGVLTLISADGQEGMISFDSGAVINAAVEDLVGEDAVYRQLLWRDGAFDLQFRRVSLSERTVHRTTQALLMEGMRRLDEWSRLSELLPSFEAVLEVDAHTLRERLGDMPDDQNDMIRLIDGGRTVGRVLRAHGGDHVEALRKLVDLYFEGIVREVGRIQDSIPILTEVSVRSSAPPAREGIHTIPGPGGSPAANISVPRAPRLPASSDPSASASAPQRQALSDSARAPAMQKVPESLPPFDQMSTPVSLPSPVATSIEAFPDDIIAPSSPPAAPVSPTDTQVEAGWQPAPPPSRSRRHTPAGFQAARPASSMYAGGTILNWAGRVPQIDRMDEISSRETVEVGRWDQSLEELREDPEVEEAIVAIDSDPPPGPFVRSTPPGARAIDEALMREQEPHRDAVIDYHEPPDVDPPPLQYEHVFGVETSDARIRAPRAVQPGSIDPASSRKPSKARWPVFVLVLGCAAAAIAYWTMPQPVTVPASAPAPAPVMAPAPVTAPASVPVTAPASEEATVTAPAPVTVPAPAAGPDSATAEGEAPIPNPNAIFPETGALDTYDAQLALARRLKRGSRAAAAYRRAIELNPASSPALAELARLMLARNHTREAAELAERATALDPTNALAWVALGAARQARGDRQGARQAYQNCAKLGKGHYVSECRAMLR